MWPYKYTKPPKIVFKLKTINKNETYNTHYTVNCYL